MFGTLQYDESIYAKIVFVKELDKLKSVYRQAKLIDADRRENSAEHSWHLALLALVFSSEMKDLNDADVFRAVQMALVHDIVEIDAGDCFVYDEEARLANKQAEENAADRIFGLLPNDSGQYFRKLWDEFEAGESQAARYAKALDRLQPILLNFFSGGGSWSRHAVKKSQILSKADSIKENLPALWVFVEEIVSSSVKKGWVIDA